MKPWMIAAAVAALVLVSWVAYASLSSGIPVEAARAELSSIREFADERAKTRLPKTHLITMPYSGRIRSIDIEEGMPVEVGQVVAEVVPLDLEIALAASKAAVEKLKAQIAENDDTTVEETLLAQSERFVDSMEQTVEAARESVKSAQAKLDYAEKKLGRTERLYETGVRTEDDLDLAQLSRVEDGVGYHEDLLFLSAMESMHAATTLLPQSVRQFISRKMLTSAVLDKEQAEADANLRQVEKDIARGTMRSPVDGVVLSRAVTNERQVAAGTVLLEIGRLEELEIEADVLSQDVVAIKKGARVEIYGPAIGNEPAWGTVKRIYPAGFTKISSLGVEQQRVRVIIGLKSDELQRLRDERDLGVGFRVRVRIYTAEKEQTLVIPRSALFRGGDGDWQAFVIRGGRVQLVPLKIGLLNDRRAEVLAGLETDELVVLAPETSLIDGTRVRPIVRNKRNEH